MTSLAQMASLDGYGLYVWGAYGLALLAVLAETLALRARLRRARSTVETDKAFHGDTKS